MSEEYFPGVAGKNYYQQQMETHQGLKYRLDGGDIVKAVSLKLRGYREEIDGSLNYYKEYRVMNDIGVSRIESFLSSAINKINHLTKYENESRVLLQLRSMIRTFIPELVINLKKWSPEAEYYDTQYNIPINLPDGSTISQRVVRKVLINPYNLKVPNWRMIVQITENAMLQSMQRAQEGFEAKNVTQQHQISEVISKPQNNDSWVNRLLGRGGN